MRSFTRWVRSLKYVVLGAHAMRRGDDDGVIENYTRAIEWSPEDLDSYYARGHAHWHKHEWGDAVADFSKALELNPHDTYGHFLRGAVYRERGYLAQAIVDLNQVIETEDGPAKAYFLRARCHSERKDYDRALSDLDETLSRDPNNEEAQTLRETCELLAVEVHGGGCGRAAFQSGNGEIALSRDPRWASAGYH